jgi:two-component system, OmpR family, alkaline phosphatase synthesis response regulator PhoP
VKNDMAFRVALPSLDEEKKRILVVEDEPAVAALMTFLLSRVGYEVENAFTGRAGLEIAITRKFDLITLDVDLPGINGFDICRELKQRWIAWKTPIIFLSGNDLEERRAKALELGASDFIAKPFIVADFLDRVELYTTGKQSDVFNEGANANAKGLGDAAQGNQ